MKAMRCEPVDRNLIATKSESLFHRTGLKPLFVIVLRFTILTGCAQGASNLNVTDFGARGDAVQIVASTVRNSGNVTIQSTNRLSSADIGKVVLLFGAGPYTSSTNNQDLLATVTQVSSGTNITVSLAAASTSTNVVGICGTQNTEAFQRCVDACAGTNTVVQIPAGRYLLIPPDALTLNFTAQNWSGSYPAITIQKGGIHFLGAGPNATVLLGSGAWQLRGSSAVRGYMFRCQGPVTNDAPLIFENLTLDGGTLTGNTYNHGFPASVVDGSGWDPTHDAVVDFGEPLHNLKIFQNCRITRWRGEALKSVSSATNGFIIITNCLFDDNNATGFNFTSCHDINGCVFSNMFQATEYYSGHVTGDCFFRNCTLTGITGNTAIALNGALTNHLQPSYNILSNRFFLSGGFGISTCPAQNVNVIGNQFLCTNGTTAIGVGSAGYQGTAINSNIVVGFNIFSNAQYAVEILGAGDNRTANMLIYSNAAFDVQYFANGYGWSTNVAFFGNVGEPSGCLNSSLLGGQFFIDDDSNKFSPWQIYDEVGRTNVISYAYGMRQRISVGVTNAVFVIDDSKPGQIPPGTELLITHEGNYPVALYASSIRSTSATLLKKGFTITCQWTNGAWKTVGLQGPLTPPQNFKLNPLTSPR